MDLMASLDERITMVFYEVLGLANYRKVLYQKQRSIGMIRGSCEDLSEQIMIYQLISKDSSCYHYAAIIR